MWTNFVSQNKECIEKIIWKHYLDDQEVFRMCQLNRSTHSGLNPYDSYVVKQSIDLGKMMKIKSIDKFIFKKGINIQYPHFTYIKIGSYSHSYLKYLKRFNSIRTVDFYYPFTHMGKIRRGTFPSSLTRLYMPPKFEKDLFIGLFPPSLINLTLSEVFNLPIRINILPQSIRYLNVGYCFNQIIEKDILPGSLNSLIFGENFNKPISIGILPNSIRYLVFGSKFNQILLPNVLPTHLEILKFSFWSDFNQPIVLPLALKTLEFGYEFNQSLEIGSLPDSLQSLKFGPHYSHILQPKVLPSNLTYLQVAAGFDMSILLRPDVVPLTIKKIVWGIRTFNSIQELKISIINEQVSEF